VQCIDRLPDEEVRKQRATEPLIRLEAQRGNAGVTLEWPIQGLSNTVELVLKPPANDTRTLRGADVEQTTGESLEADAPSMQTRTVKHQDLKVSARQK